MTGTEHVGRGAKGCKGCNRVLYADGPDYCPECMAVNETVQPPPEEPKAEGAEEPQAKGARAK